jgi:membrane protein DedA with SNARE-associated domain
MPDSAVVATAPHPPGRRTLTFLTVPIIGLVILNAVGDALAPTLVDSHPLLLIAMNSRNRNLLLVTNQLDAWSYYLVATLRLAVSDPLFFLIGYWYGDRAMDWMEQRTRTLGKTLRQWEKGFSKAAYPLVFIAPNNPICLFAGASGMSVPGFFITNLTGTLARLYALRWLGDAFDAPIDDVLTFIGDHRTPFLVGTIGLAVFFAVTELRSGRPALDVLEAVAEEQEHDAEAADEPEGKPAAPVEPE